MSRASPVLIAMRDAHAQGSAYAAYHIGVVYAEGWGVKRSDKQAFKWFLEASEGGCTLAFYHLGWAYATGQGVERNGRMARKWFERAAANGDAAAQYALAEQMTESRNKKTKAKGLKQMHRLSKTDWKAAVHLCSHYLQNRRPLVARRFARQALALDHEHGQLWVAQVERAIASRRR